MLGSSLLYLFSKKGGKFNCIDVLALNASIDVIAARANPSKLAIHYLILAGARLRLHKV